MLIKLCKLVLVCAALCAVLALNFTPTSPARANEDNEFLDLVINEGVVVPWGISNIMPGVSGVADVDMHNAGNINGYVSVWIDGITDMEGENPEAETGNTEEPGELRQYLTLNISGEHVAPYAASPDFKLPVVLSEFPQSSNNPLQLSDQPLEAGETIQLQWEWAIPPQTTNVIQGDSVSFNINYILTQNILVQEPTTLTPPTYGGGGGYWTRTPSSPDAEDADSSNVTGEPTVPDVEADVQLTTSTETTAASDDNEITKEYCSPDGKLTVTVHEETKVISAGNEELSHVSIPLSHYTPPIPENNILLSPIYNVTIFTTEGPCEHTQLDKPVTIIVDFDKDKLSEQFSSIYAARYKADSSWIKLTEVREINHTLGKLTVETVRLSLIAVFAEIAVSDDSREVILSSSGDSLISDSPDSKASQLKTDTERVPSGKSTPMREIISQASLAIAGSGTLAMTVLAYIERKRRDSKRTTECQRVDM